MLGWVLNGRNTTGTLCHVGWMKELWCVPSSYVPNAACLVMPFNHVYVVCPFLRAKRRSWCRHASGPSSVPGGIQEPLAMPEPSVEMRRFFSLLLPVKRCQCHYSKIKCLKVRIRSSWKHFQPPVKETNLSLPRGWLTQNVCAEGY